ncbi:uncharacterized protein LOC123660912 [Melitaea cinxia]|uniref:uncharacterized protein LOC123660912 n=1 Tax=Melitaea cinxia TaxID=113334 RepID=UPI001E27083A|nr:uncharacterized protein LOC123660912 [Melitaea cinxia]
MAIIMIRNNETTSQRTQQGNITNVKTLQREDPQRYADLSHFRPIILPEIPDSKLSSSSHSRGLISRDHPGYSLHDYEEYPHFDYGYDHHIPIADHHEFGHHSYDPYHYGHHYGHHYEEEHHYPSHQNKNYKNALAAKAVLWPIAGIALLGAAAALVSNPILLQLGVATGKRKRRDTEEITGPDTEIDFKKWNSDDDDHGKHAMNINEKKSSKLFQRKTLKTRIINPKRFTKYSRLQSPDLQFNVNTSISNESDEVNFIPIKLKNV